ncbi:hypothetical protein F5I97DRAFT_1808732 [Phlebopus sp. FC_14]|nr:hypothetical protein F5I97DRAFT_1808732 [Phlebopus sp. FC_14]
MPVQTRSGGQHVAPTKKSRSPRRRNKVKEPEPETLKVEEGHVEEKRVSADEPHTAEKRQASVAFESHSETEEAAAAKKPKTDEDEAKKYSFHSGVLERGHIYFFNRPKVQHEEAHTLDDVKNFHMLLVPRPPEFSVHTEGQATTSAEEQEMTVIGEGTDVVPASETKDEPKKRYRVITIGKKRLPDPEGGRGKENFWASVTAVGNDLHKLEKGLGEKTYETKTRGTRHEGPVRLVGRGVYAIVNYKAPVPSKNETHLGYHLSHPTTPGEVQEALGIHTASSFVVQVKNPLSNVPYGQRVGLPSGRRAAYPEGILNHVFEKGSKGRSEFGLRFTSCRCIELLDYEGAELLLIAARTGAQGSDESLGENRGEALKEAGEKESVEDVEDIFRELAADKDQFPAEPLEGHWI